MKKITVRSLMAVTVSLAMVHMLAAPLAIGIATGKGSFRVDDSYVVGNATLFEGAAIETGVNTGELNLAKAKVVMATDTRSRVFHDKLILDKGKVQFSGANFHAVAGEIEIVAADGASKALVERKGATVEVASLAGTVNVFSTSGESLLAVAPGMAYDFTPDPQGASPGDKAADNTKTGAKAAGHMGLATKAIIIVAVAGAGGAAAGVIATRNNGTPTSRQ